MGVPSQMLTFVIFSFVAVCLIAYSTNSNFDPLHINRIKSLPPLHRQADAKIIENATFSHETFPFPEPPIPLPCSEPLPVNTYSFCPLGEHKTVLMHTDPRDRDCHKLSLNKKCDVYYR